MSQLDQGLCLSPQRLRSHKAVESKRLFPREHVIHGPAQLVGEDRERFGFAVFVFKFSKIRFPRLALAEEEHDGFGKGPAEMDVANLFAGRAQSFAVGFFGTLDQATIRDEILHARKARDILNLIQNHQCQNLADPGDGL
jgi:hypothetical protein